MKAVEPMWTKPRKFIAMLMLWLCDELTVMREFSCFRDLQA
jgi:hypothetical protein